MNFYMEIAAVCVGVCVCSFLLPTISSSSVCRVRREGKAEGKERRAAAAVFDALCLISNWN